MIFDIKKINIYSFFNIISNYKYLILIGYAT
jgi:hypothetical protein